MHDTENTTEQPIRSPHCSIPCGHFIFYSSKYHIFNKIDVQKENRQAESTPTQRTEID